MQHVLYLPDWHPTRLRKLVGPQWAKESRQRNEDRDTILKVSEQSSVPGAEGPRKVSLHVVLIKGQRTGAWEDQRESICDGLVQAGLLKGDDPEWIKEGEVIFSRGEQRAVFIILEDC